MNITFAGGGTGGHLYPAIAIADLLAAQHSIRFIGTRDRLEARIVPHAGYEINFIPAAPLQRNASLATLRTVLVNSGGVAAAARVLLEHRPDLLIATGGYVCFPVVFAARMLRALRLIRAPIALLEINAYPGLTNRLLAPLVDEVWGAFAAARKSFGVKFVQTGAPVRESLRHPRERTDAARWFGLDPARKTILVMGGSQGARSMNEAVSALVTRRALPADWQILHVSGERDYEYMKAEQRTLFGENRVALVSYLDDLADAYAASDLVVARSGASTLGELAAIGLPAVLVPYPHAAEDHQRVNAQAFVEAGAALLLSDAELSGDSLWWTLRSAMEPAALARMREAARSLAPQDALREITGRVSALTGEKATKRD